MSPAGDRPAPGTAGGACRGLASRRRSIQALSPDPHPLRPVAAQPRQQVERSGEAPPQVAEAGAGAAVEGVDLGVGEEDGAEDGAGELDGTGAVARLGAEEPEAERRLVPRIEPAGEDVTEQHLLG